VYFVKSIKIGSAQSEPGKLVYGFIDAMELPTGTSDRIPVIIAQGKTDGPTFFISANVHGNELTGVAVIHDVIIEDLVNDLNGTVVGLPTLNPTGLRMHQRYPEYQHEDPNRQFPEGRFAKPDDDDEDPKYLKPYEQVAALLYSYFEKYADYHLDFHNHSLRSIPYSILDRIFYDKEDEKEEAEKLAALQSGMVEAYGAGGMITADFPPKTYMNLKYHRSLSGAVLNSLRKPAFTVEMGSNSVLIPEIVAGSVKATRNVLRWAGMLDSPIEKITEFEVPKTEYRTRRMEHPRVKHSGIVRILVEPGDRVSKGQAIAKISDIHGKPIGDGLVKTEHDGYMIALRDQMHIYAQQNIAEMGIKDEFDIVAPQKSKK
jgi:predicted deacylase